MLNSEQIKRNHSNSWKNIWITYNSNQKFQRGYMFWTSVVLNLIILLIINGLKADVFTLICQTTDLYLSVLPNLLGFNLGSYALLIGLASSSFLSKFTKGINKGYTFFQKASSVFAVSIILQALTLTIAFIIKQIIIIQDLSIVSILHLNGCLVQGINLIIFLGINFLGIYSLLLILMLVKNIFGLSQTANFFSGVEHLKNREPDKQP